MPTHRRVEDAAASDQKPPLQPSVLIVDDDGQILSLVRTVAIGEGFRAATAQSGDEALRLLRSAPVDLLLLDLRMPGLSGLEALRQVREVSPDSRVVLVTGYGTIADAVEAVKLGALDVLTKPVDIRRLRALFGSVRAEEEQRRAVLALDAKVAERLEFCGMIGRSPALQNVVSVVRRIAPHARAALVIGETGTGKELVARALHACGNRRDKPFIPINCSAIVEGLFESELFGHTRGSFTGAVDDKLGLIEAANGGTLFLDEVGELPPSAQAKLLRVLENSEVQRVGSLQPRKVDVRIVAATNRDLTAEIRAGRFREDLYYRLNLVEIVVPPLRERREDIPYLVAAFIKDCATRFGKPLQGVTSSGERLLLEASWPGNVRQLRNAIERAALLADGDLITETDLAGAVRGVPSTVGTAPEATPRPPAQGTLQEIERNQIVRALEQTGGNKARAARFLGISRRALYRYMDRHGLRDPRDPEDPDA